MKLKLTKDKLKNKRPPKIKHNQTINLIFLYVKDITY